MPGGSGDRPCARGRDCRTDASAELTRVGKGRKFTHWAGRKTAARTSPRDRLRMGAGHFYAGAVVPFGGDFML